MKKGLLLNLFHHIGILQKNLQKKQGDTIEHIDNIFSPTDWMRLGSIAVDLVAVCDPKPISSAIVSYGSDINNLIADIKEGRGFCKSAGAFLVNAGLSAFGLLLSQK